MDIPSSPLCRTLLAAYYRWQISDGCFLSGSTIDQAATVAIEALTGMPPHAVRNALSRDGISVLKSKFEYVTMVEWLRVRRGFVPLREEEQPNHRLTYEIVNQLTTGPVVEAVANIRDKIALPASAIDAAEKKLTTTLAAGNARLETDLRAYAIAVGAQPDTFIIAMNKKPRS